MTEEKKAMTTEEAVVLAMKQGASQYHQTVKSIIAMNNPGLINFEITAMEEFAITCLAHHVFNHGIGAHGSSVTPFGTWNASQAYTKEQEIAERILEVSKRVKQQYMEKKGTLLPINPDFKNVADNFKGTQDETPDKQ